MAGIVLQQTVFQRQFERQSGFCQACGGIRRRGVFGREERRRSPDNRESLFHKRPRCYGFQGRSKRERLSDGACRPGNSQDDRDHGIREQSPFNYCFPKGRYQTFNLKR